MANDKDKDKAQLELDVPTHVGRYATDITLETFTVDLTNSKAVLYLVVVDTPRGEIVQKYRATITSSETTLESEGRDELNLAKKGNFTFDEFLQVSRDGFDILNMLSQKEILPAGKRKLK